MSGIKCTPRPEGIKPEACKRERHCCECGKKLSRYNRPYSKRPMCYTCEDKQPWTMNNLGCGRTHNRGGE